MNKCFFVGRLTKEMELKQSASGTSYLRNSIAVDRKGKEKETDFFNVSAFGKTAEFMSSYLHKGSKVAIVGHLQSDSYTDKNGNKVTGISVIIDEIEFAEAKGEAQPKKDEFLNVAATIEEELPF